MSNHTGNWEIYTYDVGGGFSALTDNPASDGLPTWAPDGSSVAFVSNRDGTWKLYVMRPDGSNVQQILVLGPSLPGWTSQRISWAP
jgi:TolB protein